MFFSSFYGAGERWCARDILLGQTIVNAQVRDLADNLTLQLITLALIISL